MKKCRFGCLNYRCVDEYWEYCPYCGSELWDDNIR